MKGTRSTVYLDHSNLSLVPREVVEAMRPYFSNQYGHPALVHEPGRNSLKLIEESREVVSNTINCDPDEIVFTSGLTESNNLALQGVAFANRERGNHIVTSKLEPPSISRVADMLGKKHFRVERVGVDEQGTIDLDHFQELITDDTILVSISGVADEIGTIEPLKAIGEIIEDTNEDILFHTDFSNGYTRVPIDVQKIGIDLLSIGGRKIHSPPGIGCLFVDEQVNISKIMEGTLTTNDIRPGMENVPLIAGLRKAIDLSFEKSNGTLSPMPRYEKYLKTLRDRLYSEIKEKIDDILLNGPEEERSPSNLNVSFKRVEGEAITLKLSERGIYVSTGSACARRSLKPSPILKAIGRTPEESHGSILFSLSRYNDEEDINYVVNSLPEIISELRKISALSP